MPGIGVGLGVGLMSSAARRSVEIGAASTLYVGVSASISGTATPDGATVTVTVNGETWGNTTVSSGAWSVTATPTAAMVGSEDAEGFADVEIAASVPGASATASVEVFDWAQLTEAVRQYDADQGVTVTGSGVSEWAEQIAGTYALAQSTDSRRPPYNGVGLGIEFDGTDDRLDSPNSAGDLEDLRFTARSMHLFVALDRDGTDADESILCTAYISNESFVGFEIKTHSGNGRNLQFGVLNGSGANKAFNAIATGEEFTAGKHILELEFDASTYAGRLDGAAVASGSTGTLAAAGTDPTYQLRVGNATGDFDGTIFEVAMCNAPLSSTVAAKVRSQLDGKWALTP